jgi:hypothetical protein
MEAVRAEGMSVAKAVLGELFATVDADPLLFRRVRVHGLLLVFTAH